MARGPKGVPESLSQTADEALAIERSSRDGRPVGIKDIARALGISIGTVDRAIHGRGGINAITKERVLKMAQNARLQTESGRPLFESTSPGSRIRESSRQDWIVL